MTFDGFTLAAQLFNFALLLILLRVFLYRPILDLMAQREALTAAPLKEAERLAAEAAAEREALQRERAAFERERAERREAELRDAQARRAQSVAAIERETVELRRAAADAVQRDVERVTGELMSRLSSLVVDEVKATLAALAGAELDPSAWARFEEHLRALPGDERHRLAQAAQGTVRVVTPRPLDATTTDAARAALAGLLSAEQVTFATDPGLLLGFVLEAGGLRLDGTLHARLDALERSFATALDAVNDLRPQAATTASATEMP